ncbi:MAG: nucleotidyltransferase domain-containing protein [Burkholderiaceae bacterium]
MRSLADLTGSFNEKTVKGRKYWYFQFTEPSGKLHQIYVGPDSEPVHRLMAKKDSPSALAALAPLARSAIALGCAALLPRHFRVIRRLADYGFFRAGGMVIGTHSFMGYGNMLGVKWNGSDRTQDVDFAHAGKKISLLLPSNVEVKTNEAIESLEMGFLPVSGLAGKTGGTYLIPQEPEFRLDFLTPLHRNATEPYLHPQLNVTLQPLPYMEYSLEQIEQTAMISTEGAVLANVPSPERYALHKLLVHSVREGAFRTKAVKDLAQAACLLEFLGVHRPEALQAALDDLLSRGKRWVTQLNKGTRALAAAYPTLPEAARLVQATKR